MTDRYKEAIQCARDCVERNKDGGVYLPDLLRIIDKQEKEIECLENAVEMLNCELDMAKDCIPEQRAEVIKEFAENIKLEFYKEFDEIIPSIMADKIDNLVKEMGGEQG